MSLTIIRFCPVEPDVTIFCKVTRSSDVSFFSPWPSDILSMSLLSPNPNCRLSSWHLACFRDATSLFLKSSTPVFSSASAGNCRRSVLLYVFKHWLLLDSLFSSPGQAEQESSCSCCHRSTRNPWMCNYLVISVCRSVFSLYLSPLPSSVCFPALSVTQSACLPVTSASHPPSIVFAPSSDIWMNLNIKISF